ncbi:MAG: glycosyltransferase [Rhodobacteraceae bacterium]|nr:glycosyltransferase [Paracoccaceae bacterium]
MPRFSVVIPCHQAAGTIPDTLAALQAQSLSDWEAVCIDDGSRDDTARIVTDFARTDTRIRLLRNPGRGPSAARNAGVAATLGAVIAFCDADDIWSTDKLRHLAETFADPAVDGVFGRVAFFDRVIGDARSRSSVPQGPLTLSMLLGENPVCTMSNIAVRRGVFMQAGGLRQDMVHNEDLEWLIRLVGQGARIQPVDAVLVHYRASPTGLSADLSAMARGRAEALRTAARFGARPDARAEAVHLRYLARRALRLDQPPGTALRLAAQGLARSPKGFLRPFRRGAGTALACALAPALPTALRRSLFSR